MKTGSLGLIFLLIFGSSLASNAGETSDEIKDLNVSDLDIHDQKSEIPIGNMCQLCEGYAAQAQSYISQNKTRQQIIQILQETCSGLPSLKLQKKCRILMGKFGPFLVSKLLGAKLGSFCQHASHCKQVASYGEQLSLKSCGFCRSAVPRVASALKNPVTQSLILGILNIACGTTQIVAPECRLLVTSFGPLIITGLEKFMEKGDLCQKIGACASAPAPTPAPAPAHP